MSRPIKVLVVGQTPPPYHGQALMIERLLAGQFARAQLYHVRMAFSGSIDEVGRFRIGKLFHLLAVIVRIIFCRVIHGATVLYYPPAGPNRVPLYRDLVILNCTRWMFRHTILHFHAGGAADLYPSLSRPIQRLYRRALFNADAAIRLSRSSPDDGRALMAKRQYVVPNGIEDVFPRFTTAAATRGSSSLRILFMGILCESKGLLVLLEACRRLRRRGIPFELDVVGQFESDAFESIARRKVEESNLQDTVRFRGILQGDAKWQAFAEADVFCLPSFYHSESFPIVLLEAISFELPVVATRWRGIVEIVDDESTGYLVERHDADAVADRLQQLQADAELRQQMGAAGRQKFLREFALQKHLERMEQVFVEATGNSREQEVTSSGNDEHEFAGQLFVAPTTDAVCGHEVTT